jgi:hypothetical protein
MLPFPFEKMIIRKNGKVKRKRKDSHVAAWSGRLTIYALPGL